MSSPRGVALQLINRVSLQEQSLQSILAPTLEQLSESRDRALAQELCFGVLRWYPLLSALGTQMLDRPLKAKDRDLHNLICLGLYQLQQTRISAHAAVAETVELTETLNKGWAKGLVNALLRRFQREGEGLQEQLPPASQAAFPEWLYAKTEHAWPEQMASVVAETNSRPPMWLRINRRQIQPADYLSQLKQAGLQFEPHSWLEEGLRLERPCDVEALPGFAEGQVSVQDGAAQLAAQLLQLAPGQRVLDACAAPGGKTCHIAERMGDDIDLWALDIDPQRLARIEENLSRLRLNAQLISADALDTQAWFDGQPFDRILLDAPCSATGVIRRHPDIKLLRRGEDVHSLSALQAEMLDRLWPLLKPGGLMLYATCSMLPQENSRQVARFIARTADCSEAPINTDWGQACEAGRQILPGQHGMDGFYYACLSKQHATPTTPP